MRFHIILLFFLLVSSFCWAADISGMVKIKDVKKGAGIVVGCVGIGNGHQRISTSEGITLYLTKAQTVTSRSNDPHVSTTIAWTPGSGVSFQHSVPAGKYLVYVRYGRMYCDWTVVTISSDTTSIKTNLSVNTTIVGSLNIKMKLGAGNYVIGITPTAPGGKELVPGADLPYDIAGTYQKQSNGTILVQGLKPGCYSVNCCIDYTKGNVTTGKNIGVLTVNVVAGKTSSYKL